MDEQPQQGGNVSSLRLFIRLTRPLFLVGVMVVYALGAGIARYLGHDIQWGVYWLGQTWVTLLQLSTQYLNEYYNAPADQVNPNRTLLTGGSGALGPGKLPRRVALMAALVCLAVLASFTVLLMSTGALNPTAYLIMGMAFLGSFFYSTPPVRLESSGYGELTTSALVGLMVPGFAFTLQVGELHRLVAMVGFPLFAAHLSMLIAFTLPDYATDQKYDKRTLLVRMGWQAAMFLHNVMILTAYVLLLGARAFDFPTFATVAGLLSLPVGVFQIWQMNRIANGAPVNWNALTIGATAQFFLLVYLLAFAFWTY
jgi:1,4-dihydroxy-2-naphthoate octaprenyltransferase